MTRLSLPVIKFVVLDNRGPSSVGGYHTFIRCPRCCEREIIYNGNYFCSGFDSGECEWALPEAEGDGPAPHYELLEPALIDSQMIRIAVHERVKPDVVRARFGRPLGGPA